MLQLHNPNVDRQYIRKDVQSNEQCAGCHASFLDSMGNATNRLDFADNRMLYRFNFSGMDKLFRGFNPPANPNGFDPRTALPRGEENRWWNLAIEGRTSFLGWRTPSGMSSMEAGTGFRDLMRVLANTEAFSNRMVEIAATQICARPLTPNEKDIAATVARQFERGFSDYESSQADSAYNMRGLFAEASKFCFGRIQR